MFSYHLPDGGPNDVVTVDGQGNIKFDPPVYEQRYTTVIRILEDSRWSSHFKKIVDFGCGEMSLLRLMRRLERVEHILNVDVEEDILFRYQSRASPLLSDHLKDRDYPLRIEVLKGSLIDSVENLRHVDAVVAIEVIEHLWDDVLKKVPANIFGFIQPKLVIVSTPNQEYNVLFKGLNANGFRIDDHKFEWTRAQFQDWATKICAKYKNYSFATLGVGSPPPGYEHLGTVTQFAIFARNDIIDRPLMYPINPILEADTRPEVQYKEIYTVDFPFNKDNRTKEQKLKDEIANYLSYALSNERYYNEESGLYQIPIDSLVGWAQNMNLTKDDVLCALKELNFEVNGDCVVLTNDYVDKQYRYKGHGSFDDSSEESSWEKDEVEENIPDDQNDEENWD